MFLPSPRPARLKFPMFQVVRSSVCLHWFEIQKENCLRAVLPFPCRACRPASARIASVSTSPDPRPAKRRSGKTFQPSRQAGLQRKTSREGICRHCEPRKPAEQILPSESATPRVRPACRCQIRKSETAARPVLASVCFDSLPSLVMPVTADMGDGTINASADISPRQSSRGRVSNS